MAILKVKNTTTGLWEEIVTIKGEQGATGTIADLGGAIFASTSKTTPVDADSLVISDSASTNTAKKLTWANLKATLKTYFDTLYNLYVHPANHPASIITQDSSNRFVTDAEKTTWNGKETAFSKNTGFNKNFGSTAGTVVEGNDARLSDARTPTTHSHAIADVTGLQTALDGKSTYTVYTATISSASWTGASAPYSKAVTVTGMLSTDEPIIDLVMSGTYATDVTMRENWSKVYRIVTSANTITCYADSVPSADISIQLVVVR